VSEGVRGDGEMSVSEMAVTEPPVIEMSLSVKVEKKAYD
jgi:hypothetical protein